VHDSRSVLLEKLAKITDFLGDDLGKNSIYGALPDRYSWGKTWFEGLTSCKWNKGRLTNFATAIRSRKCELLAGFGLDLKISCGEAFDDICVYCAE
jgi:hypothetical protein